MPPHAYVPGQTARHPEDWFDRIKDSVTPGMEPDAIQDTAAFRAGLAYLDAGYFWECHEVLEAVWMVLPEDSDARHMMQALIQFANARLKARMQRPNAVRRLCDRVTGHLDAIAQSGPILGLSPEAVRADTTKLRSEYAI